MSDTPTVASEAQPPLPPTAQPELSAAVPPQPGNIRGDRGRKAGANATAGTRPERPRGAGGPRAPREVHPLLQRLWELHPRLFGARFRPLKLGIFEDLMARHPGEFKKDELKQALGQHVRSTRYLEAVAQGDARCDLEGNPVGEVAPEHVHHAIMEVFKRRQGRDAAAARAWAVARLVPAIQASGLDRDAYLERVHARDDVALALLDEAFAQVAEQTARREALLRAFRASGKPVEQFAEMYGLDAEVVREALARTTTPAQLA